MLTKTALSLMKKLNMQRNLGYNVQIVPILTLQNSRKNAAVANQPPGGNSGQKNQILPAAMLQTPEKLLINRASVTILKGKFLYQPIQIIPRDVIVTDTCCYKNNFVNY